MAKDGIPQTLWETQPRNVEAELNLLAAILRGGKRQADMYEAISDTLAPDHFFEVVHGEAYRLISQAMESGRTATHLTLANHIPSDLMSKLSAGSVGALISDREFKDWAEEIAEKAARRAVCEVGRQVVSDGVSAPWGTKPSDIIATAEASLYSAAPDAKGTGPITYNSAIQQALDAVDFAQRAENKAKRVTTGLRDLDRELGQMRGGDLAIIAGRTSMGKTALASGIAEFNAENGRKGAFFSLEMSAVRLGQRRLARESGVSIRDQDSGELNDIQYRKVIEAGKKILDRDLNLFIDATPQLTASQIRSRARKLHRRHGLSFIVVDYLQFMGDEKENSNIQRTYQVAKNTAALKALAKELDIPVIALAQVGRAVEKQDDKRPSMADLSDSKSIEMDADIIMFVYREEYYLERARPVRGIDESPRDFSDRLNDYEERLSEVAGIAQVIIAKARQGNAPATVDVAFDGPTTTFSDLHRG